MAIFSGKIITAHYINPEYSVVELVYEGEDGNLYAHALRADPNNPEFQALLADGWDQDKLAEGTAEYKRSSSADFNTRVNEAAKEMVQQLLVKETEKLSKLEEKALSKLNKLNHLEHDARKEQIASTTDFYDLILANNVDKDELFKLKLWALEQEIVKTADKETKSAIRKATKITQVFSLIDKLLG